MAGKASEIGTESVSPRRQDQRMTLIDRALAGQSAEAKSRVLDLILRMGIDPEDEFFLIFIALGQLQVLVEDSPHDWQELFVSFEKELRQWETKNIQTLAHLSHQVTAMRELANSAKKLTNILNRLAVSLMPLTPLLQDSIQQSQNSTHVLQESCDRQNQTLSRQNHKVDRLIEDMMQYHRQLQDQTQRLEVEIDNLARSMMAPPPDTTWIFGKPFWGGFCGALLAICAMQLLAKML